MAERKVTKTQGKASNVNGEGNEKTDNSSSTVADLKTYSLGDVTNAANVKVRGMAAGYREATRKS